MSHIQYECIRSAGETHQVQIPRWSLYDADSAMIHQTKFHIYNNKNIVSRLRIWELKIHAKRLSLYVVMDILSTWRLNNSMIKLFLQDKFLNNSNHFVNDFLIIRSSITVRLSIDEKLKNRGIKIAKISYRCTSL